MKILLVEDDKQTADYIAKGMRQHGHVVDCADNGRDGLYDAIVLDILLPGFDGFELCRRLRHAQIDTPVLMLTAKDAVADRITGLDAGADDYLVKPFAFDELLARLRALTRRGRTRHLDAALIYGPLTLDTATHMATAAGTPLELSATEYRLLEHLLRHREAIVSRDQLAEHVWGGDYDPFSNVADVYIGYLRRKLRAAGVVTPLIHTIRGLGYMLKVRPAGEAAGTGQA